MFQGSQLVSTDIIMTNNNNSISYKQREREVPFMIVDHEEIVVDQGTEHVTNFERLMKLFPSEHPSGIHGVMVICNNNIEKALDMLLYITQCRKLNVEKACLNCTSADSDLEILEENLKKIDERSDDDDGYDDDESDEDYTPTKFKANSSKQENNKVKKAPKRLLKLSKYDTPKKKTPRFTVPTKASLKAVYTDNNSQYVRVEEMD